MWPSERGSPGLRKPTVTVTNSPACATTSPWSLMISRGRNVLGSFRPTQPGQLLVGVRQPRPDGAVDHGTGANAPALRHVPNMPREGSIAAVPFGRGGVAPASLPPICQERSCRLAFRRVARQGRRCREQNSRRVCRFSITLSAPLGAHIPRPRRPRSIPPNTPCESRNRPRSRPVSSTGGSLQRWSGGRLLDQRACAWEWTRTPPPCCARRPA